MKNNEHTETRDRLMAERESLVERVESGELAPRAAAALDVLVQSHDQLRTVLAALDAMPDDADSGVRAASLRMVGELIEAQHAAMMRALGDSTDHAKLMRAELEADREIMTAADAVADELLTIQAADLAFAPNYSAVFVNGTKHPITTRIAALCKWARGRNSFTFWDVPEDIRGSAGRMVKLFQNQYAALYAMLFDNLGAQTYKPRF